MLPQEVELGDSASNEASNPVPSAHSPGQHLHLGLRYAHRQDSSKHECGLGVSWAL